MKKSMVYVLAACIIAVLILPVASFAAATVTFTPPTIFNVNVDRNGNVSGNNLTAQVVYEYKLVGLPLQCGGGTVWLCAPDTGSPNDSTCSKIDVVDRCNYNVMLPREIISASEAKGYCPRYTTNKSVMVYAPTHMPNLPFGQQNYEKIGKNFQVNIACPINFTSKSHLDDVFQGGIYNFQLQTSGGFLPVTYSIASGKLPGGLSLSPSGLISGTVNPNTTTGDYNFAVKATDSFPKPNEATNSFLIAVTLNPLKQVHDIGKPPIPAPHPPIIGPDYCAKYFPGAVTSLNVNQTITVPVKVTNCSKHSWTSEDTGFQDMLLNITLSYHWYQGSACPVWDGERTKLTQTVMPGGTANLQAKVKAPDKPGTYTLKWDMLGPTTWWSFQGVNTSDQIVVVK